MNFEDLDSVLNDPASMLAYRKFMNFEGLDSIFKNQNSTVPYRNFEDLNPKIKGYNVYINFEELGIFVDSDSAGDYYATTLDPNTRFYYYKSKYSLKEARKKVKEFAKKKLEREPWLINELPRYRNKKRIFEAPVIPKIELYEPWVTEPWLTEPALK